MSGNTVQSGFAAASGNWAHGPVRPRARAVFGGCLCGSIVRRLMPAPGQALLVVAAVVAIVDPIRHDASLHTRNARNTYNPRLSAHLYFHE
jgi:hypothetical protein